MHKNPSPDDLRVFTIVVRKASFAEAAQELGASPAFVSKRIRLLEEDLAVKLLHRTTRRVSVTEEGERVFHWALRILDDMDQLLQEVAVTRAEPRGLLRVSCSFGFGRSVVAPVLSQLVERHPGLQVRLEVFDRLVDVAGEGFDLDVRVGDEIAPHLIARRLADNHRVLCAAPAYLARRGTPRTLAELPGARLPGDQGARPPLWRVAPAPGRAGTGGEGAWPPVGQQRRDGGAVGGGWARHRTAFHVGCGALAAKRPARAGAARVAAGGQHLGRVPHAAGTLGQSAGVR